ncbi:MAG: di-trans,poly-cis-decaprenylcistransferase [Candidatus Micrarchaeota archaeon]|nr:di-trans,poly-cis-decaprenylcistransferase [Candidatus Micrarchaeota archaeon]MDE1804472.1 di-trans,poly-cis-decaprenylcistransferase [Candidatus Micrarchaeota archaeon]MDE1846639.1 di-trans,poly-cis-decaprenylcistransferase [Candidatus Micrarchaeota archaeon]
MPIKNVPKAIALIPDGNRRWAQGHKLSILSGYQLGVNKFIDFSEWCRDYGVRNITVWAFSTENFKRPRHEVETLFGIYKKAANDPKLLARLHKNRTRFNVVGDKSMLPKDLRESLGRIEKQTSGYKDRVINMLIGYGGKEDILHAAKEYARSVIKVGKVFTLTDESFKQYLRSYAVPEIDFVIRTSNEERVSGFLPWQISYSELYFTNKLWPDFSKQDLRKALSEYSRRSRRFGT